MSKLMLIDAAHPEETRVAVVADGQIEDFDFEASDKRQLRGNIYLAKVTRVEPSLQAAFVEYGGNRHGFLAFSEIHPDYYQIPVEDREALLREEEEAAEDDDDDDDDIVDNDVEDAEIVSDSSERDESADAADEVDADADSDDEDVDDAASSDAAAEAASDDVLTDEASDQDEEDDQADDDSDETASVRSKRRRVHPSKRYKIQEVIKRRQVMLIQVVKEERGNKGAAVTTYLSLAGRYGVLMPNTARGGGISRKITNAADRKRLKGITKTFDVPKGMGLIIRTAGAKRTKAEISRDYDYLVRLWKTIRDKTLTSTAPCLIHEEGDLVLRAVRDLYDREVGEIAVQGEAAHSQARGVVEMLMPDQVDLVTHHKKNTPLFINYGIEAQLDNIFSPTVTLPSGGYIVINQTEALVAVDVNSGKATRERNIETTALKTNLEAAEEACRQMRLRDLAGLVVIDFIDMEENKNNRAVEKKMKECLSIDRARVQYGRISQFGLYEISRQRRRAGVLELSSTPCPHCSGTGRTRSIESSALQLLRAIGERCADPKVQQVTVKAPAEVALYILNHKRDSVTEMEEMSEVVIRISADDSLTPGDFNIEATANGKVVPYKPIIPETPKRRRRRRNDQEERTATRALEVIGDDDEEEDEDTTEQTDAEEDENRSGGRRRRGRRGGRRRRGGSEEQSGAPTNEEGGEEDETEGGSGRSRRGRRRRVRRRTPDVALDGGEMLDAIASAPFLIGDDNSESEDKGDQTEPSEGAATASTDDSTTAGVEVVDVAEPVEADTADDISVEEVKPEAEPAEANEAELAQAVAAVIVDKSDSQADMTSGPLPEVEDVVSAPVEAEPPVSAEEEAVAEQSVEAEEPPTEEPSEPAAEPVVEEPQSLHAVHSATPAPAPKKRRIGWWNRSGS